MKLKSFCPDCELKLRCSSPFAETVEKGLCHSRTLLSGAHCPFREADRLRRSPCFRGCPPKVSGYCRMILRTPISADFHRLWSNPVVLFHFSKKICVHLRGSVSDFLICDTLQKHAGMTASIFDFFSSSQRRGQGGFDFVRRSCYKIPLSREGCGEVDTTLVHLWSSTCSQKSNFRIFHSSVF